MCLLLISYEKVPFVNRISLDFFIRRILYAKVYKLFILFESWVRLKSYNIDNSKVRKWLEFAYNKKQLSDGFLYKTDAYKKSRYMKENREFEHGVFL